MCKVGYRGVFRKFFLAGGIVGMTQSEKTVFGLNLTKLSLIKAENSKKKSLQICRRASLGEKRGWWFRLRQTEGYFPRFFLRERILAIHPLYASATIRNYFYF